MNNIKLFIYYVLFIYSSVKEYLGYFPLLVIVANALWSWVYRFELLLPLFWVDT